MVAKIIDDRKDKYKISIDDLNAGDYFILDDSLYIKTNLSNLDEVYEKFKVGFDKVYNYYAIDTITGENRPIISHTMVIEVRVDLHIVE
jgi:hypothetical protein